MTVLTRPVIRDEDFVKFREFFYRKTGIFFEESKRYFVDKRLVERIDQSGADSFRDYFITLRFQSSGEELQALINCMTVNETYFFREEYHFSCLVKSMLPEIVAHRGNKKEPLRIWSMPCSSGEEPYSVALYLQEYWKDIDSHDVELFASDIDTEILKAARQGRYNKRAVQNLPPSVIDRYFAKVSDNDFVLDEGVRSCVEFSRANVTESSDTRRFRKMDVIFCRNLLIYFDEISRRKAAEAFYDALNPGGFICLGHSESMSRISGLFKVRKFEDAIVYQKPFAHEKGAS